MKILIPNATGPDNMGDQAILHGLLSCLNEAFPGHELTILTSTPERYTEVAANRIDYNLYMWAVFQTANPFVRAWRLLCLVYAYIAYRFGLPFVRTGMLHSLINEYKQADLIVFVGGGYLRTNSGVTQSLNLLMHLVMFWFARLSKAKQVVASFSFGPFAYSWQEKLAARTLSQVDMLCVREEISQKALERLVGSRAILSTDTALYLHPASDKSEQRAQLVIGFTIRKWGSSDAQEQLVRAYVHALGRFAGEHQAYVQPIIQVDSPLQNENDMQITELVSAGLRAAGVFVQPVIVLQNLDHALHTYNNIDIILGMRMHSNILSYIQGTPFVAVSYEHKTEGICRTLGLEHYSVRLEQASGPTLLSTLENRYTHSSTQTAVAESQKVILSRQAAFVELLKECIHLPTDL